MFLAMAGESMPTLPPSNRFIRLALRLRKWLFGPLVRKTFPLAETWKRFFAPLCVFNLGIVQLCNTRSRELRTSAINRRWTGDRLTKSPKSDGLYRRFFDLGFLARGTPIFSAIAMSAIVGRCRPSGAGRFTGPWSEQHAKRPTFHDGLLL